MKHNFFLKLVEEVGEVSRAIFHGQFRGPGEPVKGTLDEELWDVLYYTFAWRSYGIDMEEAIREKERLNNLRFTTSTPLRRAADFVHTQPLAVCLYWKGSNLKPWQ